jgi:hypothetical protein
VLGVLPAHQRLDADDPTGAHVGLGLVLHHQLAGRERAAELAEQAEPPWTVSVQGGVVDHVAQMGGLGGIHGHVGPLQQLVGAGCVVRVGGHADAGVRSGRRRRNSATS